MMPAWILVKRVGLFSTVVWQRFGARRPLRWRSAGLAVGVSGKLEIARGTEASPRTEKGLGREHGEKKLASLGGMRLGDRTRI
jgi:hypothetical protein